MAVILSQPQCVNSCGITELNQVEAYSNNHLTITWTNVDLVVRLYGIYLAVDIFIWKLPRTEICLKIKYFKLTSYLNSFRLGGRFILKWVSIGSSKGLSGAKLTKFSMETKHTVAFESKYIHKNLCENVLCEIFAVLFRPQCVNLGVLSILYLLAISVCISFLLNQPLVTQHTRPCFLVTGSPV